MRKQATFLKDIADPASMRGQVHAGPGVEEQMIFKLDAPIPWTQQSCDRIHDSAFARA